MVLEEEGEVVGVGIEEDANDSEAGIRTCGCGTAEAECFMVRSLLTLSAWNRESAEQVQDIE